jgi:hypothetical protein
MTAHAKNELVLSTHCGPSQPIAKSPLRLAADAKLTITADFD